MGILAKFETQNFGAQNGTQNIKGLSSVTLPEIMKLQSDQGGEGEVSLLFRLTGFMVLHLICT